METSSPELDLDKLKAIKVLGKGAMGTVFLVHDRESNPSAHYPFALKVVDKSTFYTQFDADRRARWEVSVLSCLTHPFLPTLLGSLETDEFLAWAVPYCPGGDLNVLRYRQTDSIFSPSVIRFYLAEIVCALECLHGIGIVYRDLKPENVLIQQSGHVTLTDFDLSRNLTPRKEKPVETSEPDEIEMTVSGRKHRRNLTRRKEKPVETSESDEIETTVSGRRHRRSLTRIIAAVSDLGMNKAKSARVSPVTRRFTSGERSNSFVGTDEYVSPEVVRGDGHEFSVDWWALGILAYEMMYGKTPFRGKNRKETFLNVLTKAPEFIGKKRTDLTDLIERLLEKDPSRRLGYNGGATEIKEHEFFRGLRWDMLTEVLRPPFLPSKETERMSGTGINIKEYFRNLREQSSVPVSPLPSPSSDYREYVTLTEF